MTKINRLLMHGFKSFAQRTELIFGDEFNVVLGPNGSGKSCSYHTVVALSDGTEIKIGDLVEKKLKSAKLIKTLKDGVYCETDEPIKVLSLNQKSMKIEEKEISKFIKREGESYLYEITTRTGKKVKTTGCHPVIVFRNGKIQSTLVSSLNEKDVIASPRIIHTKGNKSNHEIGYLLGCLLGDGCIQKGSIRFTNNSHELLDSLQEIAFKKFKIKPSQIYERSGTFDIRYTDKKFISFILSFFETDKINAQTKAISNKILKLDLNSISYLIAGLYDTDGSIRKDLDTIEYCSKSKKLVNQLQRLLLRFNILSVQKERLCFASNTGEKIRRKYYYLYITNQENLIRFYENIPLKCSYKKEILLKRIRNLKKSNPNLDLLPKETNQLLKKAVQLLGIKYKPLRKEYPKLAAYIENRCKPTRNGLNEILPIFSKKLVDIHLTGLNLKIDQVQLVQAMNTVGLSGSYVSQQIGLNKQNIMVNWATNKFQAKPENLQNFFNFIESSITSRILELKGIMNTLYNLENSDIFWDNVVSIKKVKGEKYVYDLTIPDCHNFIGNGVFVHNSNILDALCFVLGRRSTKALRAEKSANLIYNGGKIKKPMNQGEVSIWFDNKKKTFPTDDSEVKISRIIKKNGQSVYKINDKKRTRQQILELMAVARIDPEGYNIILQGDIIRFTEMHLDERRKLIEEISGISVYEERKNKALKELEKVEEKLKEADIVLNERNNYMKELRKERDQALKFKELKDRITENKATYTYINLERTEKEKQEIEKKIKDRKVKIDELQSKVRDYKSQIEEKKNEISDISKEIEKKGEKEQVSLHKDIEQTKVQLATDKTRVENLRTEIEKISLREIQLKKDLKEIDNQIAELNSEKEKINKSKEEKTREQIKLESQTAEFKKKNQLDNAADIDKEIARIDSELEVHEKKAHESREHQQQLLREKDQNEFKLNSIDEKISKVNEVEKEHKKQIGELKEKKQLFKKTILELNQRLNKDSEYATLLSDAKKRLQAGEEKLAKLRVKDISLQENFSNFALKKILNNKSLKGVHGTISQLGSVNSRYAIALEIAAGARMNSIVVENDKVAADCIKYLKQNRFGTATFIPLNKINPRKFDSDDILKLKGVHGLAIELITFDSKFKKAFSHIFGNTVVVDDIDTARKVGIGKTRMVTLDGDMAEISGIMQGGYRKKQGRTGFQQKEVIKEIKENEELTSELKSKIDGLEKQREDNELMISKLRQQRAEVEGETIKLEKSMHLESSDLDANLQVKHELSKKIEKIDEGLNKFSLDISELNKTITRLKTEKQNFRNKINELRNPALLAQLNAFEEKKAEFKDELLELDNEIKTIYTKINNILIPEKIKIKDIIKQQTKESDEFGVEIEKLNNKLVFGEKELVGKEKNSQKFYAAYKGLFVKKDFIGDEIQKIENKVEGLREQSKNEEIKMNKSSLENARISAEYSGLKNEFEQYEGVKINKDKEEEELKKEIQKFERMVVDIGSVNMRALEVYEDIEKEYSSLLEKKDKLIQEKDEVISMMDEIEGKKKGLFMKTFNAVNEHFKRNFSELSIKGDASLVLENPDNAFDGGLDIKVRIAGTKFLDIRSLSGGEKTMTALAFIFAIQEHEPHSFYVLDEVDAALDKHNSEKLGKLIKKYCDKAQYLMISHNDGIISEADNLYGISMNEHGVSKIVSLKL